MKKPVISGLNPEFWQAWKLKVFFFILSDFFIKLNSNKAPYTTLSEFSNTVGPDETAYIELSRPDLQSLLSKCVPIFNVQF